MQYRVYLFDENGHIAVAEFFPATNEQEAAEIAAALYESCSDAFARYEVWRGADRIPDLPGGPDAIERHPQSVLELAESLHRSFATVVGRSRKLAEVQERLRKAR